MKIKKFLALLLLFIIIAGATTLTIYFTFIVDAIRIYDMDIEVTEGTYGISGDTDGLHFGKMSLTVTGHATKKVKVANQQDHPSYVAVSFSGDLEPWASVSENNFLLEPHEEKELKFFITVPKTAEPGYYTGTTKIVLKRYFG